MDRRAVYLGRPSAAQRCPSHAIGRVRAILVDPSSAPGPSGASSQGPSGASASGQGEQPRAKASALAPPLGSPSTPGAPFTGLGFDACAAPSQRTMSAWEASPYRAVGVYIGGLNRACSQPNLTTEWVDTQLAAGWHLIPTYVGRQAPTSSCSSCAELSPSRATAQGAAAADDAVKQAQRIGIGPGNPIYFDMESYTRTSSATRATLTFLSAWTGRLHALGYTSGVYSSSASGIADLANAIGGRYLLPDDLWIANWNGKANTIDPFVPANAWSNHQRLHQYRGGHNETYRRVTINIDNNYVEGATVGAPQTPQAPPPLSVLRVKPAATTVRVRVRCGRSTGEICPGQMILRSHVRVRRPRRGRRRARSSVVRVAVARRRFRLGGGRAHTFKVALNSRGRPLARKRRALKAQLLVATPGARATRVVRLRKQK